MQKLIEKIKAAIYALIPGKVSNKMVISVMEYLRKLQKRSKKDFTFHLHKNECAFEEHKDCIERNGGFVEDQKAYTDMWFGSCTMKFSGCEIIAAYNALANLLGKQLFSLAELIAEFEKDGMMLTGKFGTAPRAIRDFFDRHGFSTNFTVEEKEFDELGEKSDSLILTLYNDRRDIRKEVHTVNVSKENGVYLAHNVYGNGMVVGPAASVRELIEQINEGKAKGLSLLGISCNKDTILDTNTEDV